MIHSTKNLDIVKDNISPDRWRPIQGGESMRGELSSGSLSSFAFNDVGDSQHALLRPLVDHYMVDDTAAGFHAFAKINSPPLADCVVSTLKRELFRVIDVKKSAESMRLVSEKNTSNKLISVTKKNKEVTYHKYCGKWTLYIKGKKEYLMRYKCGSWRCPKCSVGLAQRQFMKIQSSLENFKNAVFFTLTFDPKKLNNSEAEGKEGRIWNQLLIYLERKIGKSEFYWSREWQPGTGMLHKHVLILNDKLFDICEGVYCKADRNRLIASKKGKYYDFKMWLESVVVGRGYGKICDVERPRSTDAIAKYIVKEITKTNQKKDDYRSNLRMHGNSRGFFKKGIPEFKTEAERQEYEILEEQTRIEKEKRKEEKKEVYIIKGSIEAVKECLENNGFYAENVMDNIVYEKNVDGKIEAVGSELGSFCIENGSGLVNK